MFSILSLFLWWFFNY